MKQTLIKPNPLASPLYKELLENFLNYGTKKEKEHCEMLIKDKKYETSITYMHSVVMKFTPLKTNVTGT